MKKRIQNYFNQYYSKAASFFPPEARFIFALYVLLLLYFGFLRLALLQRNIVLAEQIPSAILTMSFLTGMRFDLAISSYMLIPLFVALMVFKGRSRSRVIWLFCIIFQAAFLLGLAEAEFYSEFESRFNTLVFEYLSHPNIVAEMIWEGYPVVRYVLLWMLLAAFFAFMVRRLFHFFFSSDEPGYPSLSRILGSMGMLVLMVFASRGGFGHEPLRWGDAFFSESTFANHLALNGMFSLGRSVWDKIYSKQAFWTKAMPVEEAFKDVRELLFLPDESDMHDKDHPILRRGASSSEAMKHKASSSKPMNVVVILMESFSGRYVGALGAREGLTPEFDRLSERGALFERAFSNGTHTHQGVYASLCSFPHLPGYDYLMKMMEANQEFSSLPGLLKAQGYQTLFLYNGLFSWDNKEGFFRHQGIDRFIGSGDYVAPTFVDPVWGVCDYDVFSRANSEFSAMSSKGPFLGVILTLSNHQPFNLPSPLPFERIETGSPMDGRHNGIRYSDWALGEFFRQARQEEYFQNTLFVITGDHGFAVPPMITDLQLSRFHVPLLFYSESLFGSEGLRRNEVASQVDIVPSVLGLLGLEVPHQSWGRNLFSPVFQDEGFALIKPSGGEETVGFVRGNRILIMSPKRSPHIYRYSFGSTPSFGSDESDHAADRRMARNAQALIESGIVALNTRRLGAPISTSFK